MNEIIVPDLKGPKRQPSSDWTNLSWICLRAAVPETHRKQGKPLNWRETPVAAGTKPGNGWQVKVNVPEGRYFCLKAGFF